MNTNIELFEDAKIKKVAYDLWESVISSANTVIFHANKYGFSRITIIPDPNIHQMLATLRGIEKLLDGIIDDTALFEQMDHDDIRHILNAKDALRRMQNVALTLQENNEDKFDKAVKELKGTSPF